VRLVSLACILVILLFISPAFAQDDGTCPTLVQAAYERTLEICEDADSDEACYGNLELIAEPSDIGFDAMGDIVEVADIEGLRLSEMNIDEEVWGIAMMRVSMLPNESDTPVDVQMIIFGNVQIENLGGKEVEVEPVEIELTATAQILIHAEPSSSSARVNFLNRGDVVTGDGRVEAGDWYRVIATDQNSGEEVYGWVSANRVTAPEDGDVEALSIIDPESGEAAPGEAIELRPMQAFNFAAGVDDAPCEEAPDSGILIQTPDGAGEITFLVNEVAIDVASTVYITAKPGADLKIRTLEGAARAAFQADQRTIPAGGEVNFPLDANTRVAGAPTDLTGYDEAPLQNLPIGLLDREIETASPLILSGVFLNQFVSLTLNCPGQLPINVDPGPNNPGSAEIFAAISDEAWFTDDGSQFSLEKIEDNTYQTVDEVALSEGFEHFIIITIETEGRFIVESHTLNQQGPNGNANCELVNTRSWDLIE